jgi:integrase/recombinase XerD
MGNSVYGVNSQISPCRAISSDTSSLSLIYDRSGNRKYLMASERRLFLDAVEEVPPELRTFCRVLSYTGARISEVLALTPTRIDAVARLVIVESLKKRQRGIFRAIPLPIAVLDELDHVHHLTDGRGCSEEGARRL